MPESKKYADVLVEWLAELGYGTCFFVAGGNSMHLLDGFRKKMNCIPVVHEVSAGIAAEYFNVHSREKKAVVLVTAGPGLTNCITAIAGAWLESRELLVIGGQVKSTDLLSPGMRQRGIQEIDGVELTRSITKLTRRLTQPAPFSEIAEIVSASKSDRKGPCFLEVCLDVQGASVNPLALKDDVAVTTSGPKTADETQLRIVQKSFTEASRPVILLGGGIDRELSQECLKELDVFGVPILTTWNGADRYASDRPMWFGRPDTWGMRFSNLVLQQSDCVLALGARLSLQQTGFNWQQFVPEGKVIHVDIDKTETDKGHPSNTQPLNVDANDLLRRLVKMKHSGFSDWVSYCTQIKNQISLNDEGNSKHNGYLSPYEFVHQLSKICSNQDAIVPCSSGGANTVMMQGFLNKTGQIFFNNKALASMGYGLAGAIGAAIANRENRTVLVEGDGGFVQNLQELATVAVNNLNIKTFIFSNEGYASIRMTQRNYFDGDYLGCDTHTGLGFPNWNVIAAAYDIGFMELSDGFESDTAFNELWNQSGPSVFIVPVHPDQTYFPKITSRITPAGSMESAPLHLMSPDLSEHQRNSLLKYIPSLG